jgi:hypothetical protein
MSARYLSRPVVRCERRSNSGIGHSDTPVVNVDWLNAERALAVQKASTARPQMKHRMVLIVTNTILDDGIFRGERRDILVIGDLEKRYAIAASGIHHRAMSDNQTLLKKFI